MNLRSILQLDARLSEQMRVAEQPGALRSLASILAQSGDSWLWAAGLMLAWLFSNSFWRKWEIVELVGISVTAALVMGIKFIVRRKRPEGEWGGIYRNTDPHSFPSGHAARSFFIAVIAMSLSPMWLAIILWLWAPLVALARVAMGVHYVSDVVAGAIVGVVFALIFLQIYQPLFLWATGILGFPMW